MTSPIEGGTSPVGMMLNNPMIDTASKLEQPALDNIVTILHQPKWTAENPAGTLKGLHLLVHNSFEYQALSRVFRATISRKIIEECPDATLKLYVELCQSGCEDEAILLLSQGLPLDRAAQSGHSILGEAMRHDLVKLVKEILSRDGVSQTPETTLPETLAVAIENGYLDVSAELIKIKPELLNGEYGGLTPLARSIALDAPDAIRQFLDRIDSETIKLRGESEVSIAINADRSIELTILKTEDGSAPSEGEPTYLLYSENSLLQYFASEGRAEEIQMLLDMGFDYRSKHENDCGNLLHSAVMSQDEETVLTILEYGAMAERFIDERNGQGLTPLNYLCSLAQEDDEEDWVMILRHLIGKRADPNIEDDQQMSPLLNLMQKGLNDLVSVLVDADVLVTLPPEAFPKVLSTAIRNGFVRVVEGLVELNPSACAGEHEGLTALALALTLEKQGAMRALLEEGKATEVDLPGAAKIRLTKAASGAISFSILKTIMGEVPPEHLVEFSLKDGEPLLNRMAVDGRLTELQLLLEMGFSPYATSQRGRTLLHAAASSRSLEMVAFVLSDVPASRLALNALDNEGQTPLGVYCSGIGFETQDMGRSIINAFADRGADLNLSGRGQMRPVLSLLRGEKWELALHLVEKGASLLIPFSEFGSELDAALLIYGMDPESPVSNRLALLDQMSSQTVDKTARALLAAVRENVGLLKKYPGAVVAMGLLSQETREVMLENLSWGIEPDVVLDGEVDAHRLSNIAAALLKIFQAKELLSYLMTEPRMTYTLWPHVPRVDALNSALEFLEGAIVEALPREAEIREKTGPLFNSPKNLSVGKLKEIQKDIGVLDRRRDAYTSFYRAFGLPGDQDMLPILADCQDLLKAGREELEVISRTARGEGVEYRGTAELLYQNVLALGENLGDLFGGKGRLLFHCGMVDERDFDSLGADSALFEALRDSSTPNEDHRLTLSKHLDTLAKLSSEQANFFRELGYEKEQEVVLRGIGASYAFYSQTLRVSGAQISPALLDNLQRDEAKRHMALIHLYLHQPGLEALWEDPNGGIAAYFQGRDADESHLAAYSPADTWKKRFRLEDVVREEEVKSEEPQPPLKKQKRGYLGDSS